MVMTRASEVNGMVQAKTSHEDKQDGPASLATEPRQDTQDGTEVQQAEPQTEGEQPAGGNLGFNAYRVKLAL